MKSFKYFLSAVISLNSFASFAGPKEEAQKSIDQSHRAARLTAESLLQSDMQQLTKSILLSPSKNFAQSVAGMPQVIQQLNQKVLAQLNRPFSVETMDVKQLNELVQAYEALVRERFAASFQLQNIIYERQMNLRAFELPFEGFAAMCRTGRSQKDVIGDPGSLPRIPPNQYSFSISYGDQGTSMSASANSPDSNAKDRNNVSNVLGTSAGIATSIALSGGTGASVAMAMTVAPYLAGAFLAYAAYNFVVSNQEGIDLQNEATQAQVNLFQKAATDRDVANYYKESCATTLQKLEPLYKTIHDFYESDVRRDQIAAEMVNTREARKAYQAEAMALEPARSLAQLAFWAHTGFCDAAKADAPCAKVGTVFTSKQDPALKIDTVSKDDLAAVEKARSSLKAFNEKYPQEVAIQYQAHNALDIMYFDWQNVSATLMSSSFAAVDQAMALLAGKVRYFVLEVQKVQKSSWARSIRLIDAEEKLQRQFFELRGEYFQLLANSIKILFNKADAKQGKAQFSAFAKRFDAFASLTISNPDVKAMNESVQGLKKFYETL